jgi:uncharacterized protein (DUF1684 family)
MRSFQIQPFSLAALLLFSACGQQDHDGIVSSTAGNTAQDDATWTAELEEHRKEIDESLRSSNTSPMAGTQYLKSDPGDLVYLTRQERSFGLAETTGPETVLSVRRKDGAWHWSDEGPGVVCRVGEEIVASGGALEGSATFEISGLFLRFHPSEDRVTFIVFDPDREEKRSFDHLLYFPPDRKYAVDTRLTVLADPEEIEIPTSRNLMKTFYRYAKLTFQLDGQRQELTALKSTLTGEGSEYLFIPFRDATTGRETYGAGRFLDMEEPDEEHFVLDFNRAYNPLCNYSPAYNCALPPRENHLEVAIRAGEMTYPH